jgi:hypothetical protein
LRKRKEVKEERDAGPIIGLLLAALALALMFSA